MTYRAVDGDLQQVVEIKKYLPREVAFRDRDSQLTADLGLAGRGESVRGGGFQGPLGNAGVSDMRNPLGMADTVARLIGRTGTFANDAST